MALMVFRGRYLPLDLLAALFGISSWISINGLWVELPLMVDVLPESWSLASYLSLIVQFANVGPVVYALLLWRTKGRLPDGLCIYVLLIVGTLSAFLLSQFWSETAVVGGTEHSISLFALVFCLSLVDCTSSILFLPFMAVFRDIYLNSYLVGEGLSGFIPSVAALSQGVGGNGRCENVSVHDTTMNETYWEVVKVQPEPRFPIEDFFNFLAAMMAVSLASFILMNVLPRMKAEHSSRHEIVPESAPVETTAEDEAAAPLQEDTPPPPWLSKRQQTMALTEEQKNEAKLKFIILLSIQALVCFLSNGALPSVQTYSCLPYGNVVYHLTVTLSAMANPVMAFSAFFFPTRSAKKVTALTAIGLIVAGYVLATALRSPSMIAGQNVGGFLTVAAWVLSGGIFSYVKVSIAGSCRDMSRSALFWCGATTQIGSAAGAFVMFFLVNYASIFHAYYLDCSGR